MNYYEEQIEQMGENEVRVLLSQAYHRLNHCEASMVNSHGQIQMLGREEVEGYSRRTEHANHVVQRCQSRLNTLHHIRSELQRGVIIHHILSSVIQQHGHKPMTVVQQAA